MSTVALVRLLALRSHVLRVVQSLTVVPVFTNHASGWDLDLSGRTSGIAIPIRTYLDVPLARLVLSEQSLLRPPLQQDVPSATETVPSLGKSTAYRSV